MTKSVSNDLALLGGQPIGKIESPHFPFYTARAIKRVGQLLVDGKAVGLGKSHSPEIVEAEEAVSAYHGGQHCLTTSSGHGALQMALAGLEIGPGDEVITTPYTWGASISCILHQGAIPIFADVDPKTGLIDPKTIPPLISKRTRAILAVHIFGQPANMPAIMTIAKKHGLVVIEDGSQAHGASFKGKKVGNFGDAAGFSCMGGKLLATTEAGYLVTPNKDVYWKASLLCQHMGRSPDKGFPSELLPYADSLVYTYRMTPINAVLLTEQLKKLDKEVDHRRRNVEHLRNYLSDSRFVSLPNYKAHEKPAYHILTMNFDHKKAGISRDIFLDAIKAEGLMAMAYVPSPIPSWKRLHWQNYRGPKATWIDSLKRSGIDYRNSKHPNCERKIASALDMGFNFYKPAKNMMKRIADIIYKVEANIDTLKHSRKK